MFLPGLFVLVRKFVGGIPDDRYHLPNDFIDDAIHEAALGQTAAGTELRVASLRPASAHGAF